MSDTIARLPLIDLSRFAESEAERDRVAAELDQANREYGFFYLIGHGVDPFLIAELERLARDFFAGDAADKDRIHMSRGGRAWRGYFPIGGELTSGLPDLKEGIYFGTELDRNDVRVRSGTPLHGPNLFPGIPGFREAVLEYMAALTDLGQRLSAAIARGLGLADSYFRERYTSDPTILFRIFNYPPDRRFPAQPDSWGVGEHTDYGLLTILHQDDVGGLQVRHGQDWIDVPKVPGSFVCNVGDMLERLTGGRYLSALHRAKNVTQRQRLSMAFFFDPAFDAVLEPIANAAAGAAAPHTNVRWDAIDPNTIRGTYGDYLLSKVSKVFPELGEHVLTPT
jgi:isopenicillin N synthase-like dioxygenase